MTPHWICWVEHTSIHVRWNIAFPPLKCWIFQIPLIEDKSKHFHLKYVLPFGIATKIAFSMKRELFYRNFLIFRFVFFVHQKSVSCTNGAFTSILYTYRPSAVRFWSWKSDVQYRSLRGSNIAHLKQHLHDNGLVNIPDMRIFAHLRAGGFVTVRGNRNWHLQQQELNGEEIYS